MVIISEEKTFIGLDCFCGAGGLSKGFLQFFEQQHIEVIWYALNHWQTAIDTHTMNFPHIKHFPLDIYKANPRELIPGGKLDLMVGSPACTFHSNAKGGGKCDEQSRAQAFEMLRFARDLDIRAILIENVKEFMDWGPLLKKDTMINGKLHEAGCRDPRYKGRFFNKFLKGLRQLGYKIEYRILNSADYGAFTARNRFFLIATKGPQRINWPAISHARNPGDLFVKPWRPARDIIDWSIKGDSVFMRQAGLVPGKVPLCENTIKRICYGLKKFCGLELNPYLVMLYGQSTAGNIDLPLPTVTTRGHLALCTPYIMPVNYSASGEKRVYSLNNPIPTLTTKSSYYLCHPFLTKLQGTGKVANVDLPLPTVTTNGNHFGIVTPYLIQYHGGSDGVSRCYDLGDPLPVVDTGNRYAICEPFFAKNYSNGENVCPISDPLPTVTTKDRFSLIQPFMEGYQLDILYRMLEPHELAAAMGFGPDYKFAGTRTAVKKQIGNAVEVHQSYALASAIVPELMAI